jgi:uncharacterized glyoxalase superfamily protein PhnB
MANLQDHESFNTLTPYIIVKDAMAAIAFYEKALGAQLRGEAMKGPDGKVMNAQLVIGDSVLMLNDEFPDYGALAPRDGQSVFVTIHIRSEDIESDWKRAVDAGVTVTMPLEDQFWGDRYGQFTDPFGYSWSIGQKIGG